MSRFPAYLLFIPWLFSAADMEEEQEMGRKGRAIIKLLLGSVLCHLLVFYAVFRRPVTKWKRENYDCALVCGYPACKDGSPSKIMKTRVERAVELWQAGKVKMLLFSGGAAANPFVEADVMKEYAEALGAEADCILTERRSVSTYHNLKYSREVMEDHGLKDCVVVTNRWHLRKADHYARKFGLDYVMCPARDKEGRARALCRLVSTDLHMYLNLYRGYH